MSEKCPVCQTSGAENGNAGCETWRWSCPRCGEFYVLGHNIFRWMPEGDIQKRAALSHWIRTEYESMRKRNRKDPIRLTRNLVDDIIKNAHPSPMDQASSLIRWVGDNSRAGEIISVDKCRIEAIVGCVDAAEFTLVFDYLRDQGITTGERRYGDTGAVRSRDVLVGLSFPGWERYQELKQATSDSRKAFMAMQFNEPLLKDIVDNVFTPAVKQTGFDLSVLPPRAGLIDDTLNVEIRTSRFLIADLTHDNNGAYWEAGFAEGLGKPVIYTCEKTRFEECTTHFDTNHRWTVRWDSEKREETANELKTAIRATLPAEANLTDD